MNVSDTSLAAARHLDGLAILNHISNDTIVVVSDGPERNLYDYVDATFSMLLRWLSTSPVVCPKGSFVLEALKTVQIALASEDDVATAAAISSVGPTERDEFFMPEADNPIAPVS